MYCYYHTLVLLLCLLIGQNQSTIVRGYVQINLPEGAFQVTDTISNVAIRSQCDKLAWKRGKYVFKHDENSKICEVGWADLVGIQAGGPDRMYIRGNQAVLS